MRRRITIIVATSLVTIAIVICFVWYFDWGHDPVEKLPWLHGQPLMKVFAELGQPYHQLEYTMGKSPGGEFRVELYNTYPPNDRETMDVRIKELQWHRSRYHIAVWTHLVNGEWIV